MSHGKHDRVQETTTSAGGTGALTLAGASAGFRAFSSVKSNGDTFWGLITFGSPVTQWEISLCTYNAGTVSRGSVLSSSTGAAVSFSATGPKTITDIAPASKAIVEDNNGDVSMTRDVAVGRNAAVAGVVTAAGSNITAATPTLRITDSGTNQQGGINVNNTVANSVFLGSFTNNDVAFGVNNSERARFVASSGSFNLKGSGTAFRITDTPSNQQGGFNVNNSIANAVFLGSFTVNDLVLGTSNAERLRITSIGHVLAGTDNALTLGGASNRWAVVYAGTGTINTSGRDAKVLVIGASDAEKRAAAQIKALVRKYKFADAVEAKGEAAARWHFGYIAEDCAAAMEAEGLDPWAYGFMCADPIIEREIYTETATRPKMEEREVTEQRVEVVDGQPVLKSVTVTDRLAVGAMVAVKNESGETVMVDTGEKDGEGNAILAPMQHFVPEMEEYQEERAREVDTGQVRYGLRYAELEAFLRCAD